MFFALLALKDNKTHDHCNCFSVHKVELSI
jgi:hypothetical protein